jgi:hypothetical protein
LSNLDRAFDQLRESPISPVVVNYDRLDMPITSTQVLQGERNQTILRALPLNSNHNRTRNVNMSCTSAQARQDEEVEEEPSQPQASQRAQRVLNRT